jgi:4-alpha-glucanotransferase
VPDRLRDAGYEPFIQTIRACLRHAGGLRIDHVMGLFRLFWIPTDMAAGPGAHRR